MLAALSSTELGELFASAAYMRIPAGTVMFDEEQPCRGFPLLLSGSARVVKASAGGRELHLYHVLPGETCTLTTGCLIGEMPYNARGIVREEMEVAMLPPRAFHLLYTRVPAFRDQIYVRFSQRMAELLELVAAVAFQKLDQRLAASLVARPTPIRTTHQALADELGSLREIISRLLKSFADQGWVRLGREQIEILNPGAMRSFVNL